MATEHLTQTKCVAAIWPELNAVDSTSFATPPAIDTLGYDWARFVWMTGATDGAMGVLKLTECTTSGGAYTDVTGAVFGTSTNIAGSTSALPAASGAGGDETLKIIDVDLRGRHRYLKIAAETGDVTVGTAGACLCILGGGDTKPVSASECGAHEILRVHN